MPDYKWTTYSENLNTEAGFFASLVSKPIDYASCINSEGFTKLTVFTSDKPYAQQGYEQFQILQSCAPEGSMIEAFLYSDPVTTYTDFCNFVWAYLPF